MNVIFIKNYEILALSVCLKTSAQLQAKQDKHRLPSFAILAGQNRALNRPTTQAKQQILLESNLMQ
jgi:hypothetical protein